MSAEQLELLIAPDGERQAPPGWAQAQFADALAGLKRLDGLLRWRSVRLLCVNPYAVPNPLRTYLALMLLSPGSASIEAFDGSSAVKVDLTSIARAGWRGLFVARKRAEAVRQTLESLEKFALPDGVFAPAAAPPFYLRTNLWFGAKVGGSFSHAAGVVNAFDRVFGGVEMATTDIVPSLDSDVVVKRIDLSRIEGWNAGAALHFIANDGLFHEARRLCSSPPLFVYQRSGLGDISGLRLARHWRRPLVLEYNGPEVWVAKNWGHGIALADAFEAAETGLLRRADLVLVVSRSLREEAVGRGVDPSRILVSPNAVDPDRFRPDVDGGPMRARLGLGRRRAAILLSSFGPWHGTEIAVEAFAALLAERPGLRDSVALVLAGDGQRRRACMDRARELGLVESETVYFPGAVAAQDAPSLLAAGEVLLSPTTPNPDGSEFFGSPTKIFEYMAMGRTIIASNLAQIGEILVDKKTALLVRPGDAEDLMRALIRAFDSAPDPTLGAAARQDAVEAHSWVSRMRVLQSRLSDMGADCR